MKKITFILLAFFTGTTFAQSSVSGTANVNAEIVSPLKISSTGVLNFGKIASLTEKGGFVRINPDGSAFYEHSEMRIASNTVGIPVFTVESGQAYRITTQGDELNGPGDAVMIVRAITTNLDESVPVTAENFNVGGTIDVGVNQDPGEYTGEITVTVTYE